MFRKALIPLLLDGPRSVLEIARAARVSPQEAEADLRHLLRSLRHLPYEARVTPAQCRKCGFQFRAETLRKPSKCPRCRGTWIEEPRVALHAMPPRSE